MKRKRFHRNWLEFLISGLWLLIAFAIFGGFYGFIKDDNWLGLSALATLTLAFGAFWAIWQTRGIQESEKGERLLDEIIEWAEDITKCVFEVDIAIAAGVSREEAERLYRINTLLKYRTINVRTKYVEGIVSSVFSNNLAPLLKSVTQTLNWVLYIRETYIKYENVKEELIKEESLIEQEIRAKMGERAPKANQALLNCETLLHTYALSLIEEATKIKTRDIGKKEENMSEEGEATGTNEPTLKDIEKHLKWQDKQAAKGIYVTGAVFGSAIALIGVSFSVQILFELSPYIFIWFFIVVGLLFMLWCFYQQSRIK